MRIYPLIIFSFISCYSLLAQNTGNYFIKNFKNKDYGAGYSNFDIIQDSRGIVYAANYNGILEYDGSTWKIIPTKSAVLSLEKNKYDQIFVGLIHDFGVLKPDSSGSFYFHSLVPLVQENITVSSIYNVLATGDDVYFYSPEIIYHWNGTSLNTIHSGESLFTANLLLYKNNAYIFNKKRELFRLDGKNSNKIHQFESNFQNVAFIDSLNDVLVLSTRSNGFIKFPAIENPSGKAGNNFIIKNRLFVVEKLSSPDLYALGSYNNGIGIVDTSFNLKHIANKATGLQSNIVKGLHVDQNGNLWAALQEGLSFIEINSPFQLFDYNLGIKGIPWDMIIIDEEIYIATTEGLYRSTGGQFENIYPTSSRIWTVNGIKENKRKKIFAFSTSGIEEINLSKLKKISDLRVSKYLKIDTLKNEFILGHNDGLSLLSYHDNTYRTKEILLSSGETFQDLALDNNGNLWASSKFKGIYKVSDYYTDNPKVNLYNKEKGLPDVNEINIINFKDQLLFSTTKGFYYFSEQQEEFKPYNKLPNFNIKLAENIPNINNSFYIVVNEENEYAIKKIIINEGESYSITDTPFKRLKGIDISFLYPEDNGILWIGTTEGLIRYDPNINKNYDASFNTLIRKVSTGDSLIFNGNFYSSKDSLYRINIINKQTKSFIPSLPYSNNNLAFQYSAAFYEVPEKIKYSYFLEGKDEEWSQWSSHNIKEYNNLAPGKYTFHVKSKNIYDNIGETAAYTFKILPPWYMTTWAYILFFVVGILLLWAVILIYTYRIRVQRRKLKLLVADRTFEVIIQKKEIEKQNLKLKLQNEEIGRQRDDIEFKNIALQKSQEEILSINERLQELNNSLERKVEKRTEKIKTTLQKLKLTNKELDTFIYRASHDLKGPISRIYGLTSLAKLEGSSNGTTKYLDLIQRVTSEMQGLLSKLTEVHEVVNRKITKENIDLLSVLGDIKESVINLAQSKNDTRLHFKIEGDEHLYSDKTLVKIILDNLIENALIFRKEANESHQVFVETREDVRFNYIMISDNGIGIDPEIKDKVFEMFFRGSEQSKGSGLGLYLVKTAVEKLHGRINVEVNSDNFTVLTVILPK